ncbi:MAG: Bipolar DNA helicase HerA, partial [uncultured Rubrobacteraceae bacterium]
ASRPLPGPRPRPHRPRCDQRGQPRHRPRVLFLDRRDRGRPEPRHRPHRRRRGRGRHRRRRPRRPAPLLGPPVLSRRLLRLRRRPRAGGPLRAGGNSGLQGPCPRHQAPPREEEVQASGPYGPGLLRHERGHRVRPGHRELRRAQNTDALARERQREERLPAAHAPVRGWRLPSRPRGRPPQHHWHERSLNQDQPRPLHDREHLPDRRGQKGRRPDVQREGRRPPLSGQARRGRPRRGPRPRRALQEGEPEAPPPGRPRDVRVSGARDQALREPPHLRPARLREGRRRRHGARGGSPHQGPEHPAQSPRRGLLRPPDRVGPRGHPPPRRAHLRPDGLRRQVQGLRRAPAGRAGQDHARLPRADRRGLRALRGVGELLLERPPPGDHRQGPQPLRGAPQQVRRPPRPRPRRVRRLAAGGRPVRGPRDARRGHLPPLGRPPGPRRHQGNKQRLGDGRAGPPRRGQARDLRRRAEQVRPLGIQDQQPQRHPGRHLGPRAPPQPHPLRRPAVPLQGRRRGSRQRRHQPLRPHRRRGADQLQLPLLLRHHPRGAPPARKRPPPPAPRPLRRPRLRHLPASDGPHGQAGHRHLRRAQGRRRDLRPDRHARPHKDRQATGHNRHPWRHRRRPRGAGLRGPGRRPGRPPYGPRRRRPVQELPLEPHPQQPPGEEARVLANTVRPGSDEGL